MKYGISTQKLAHIIQDHPNNGFCGFWRAACGREFHPVGVSNKMPQGIKLCARCAAKIDMEAQNGK